MHIYMTFPLYIERGEGVYNGETRVICNKVVHNGKSRITRDFTIKLYAPPPPWKTICRIAEKTFYYVLSEKRLLLPSGHKLQQHDD